MQQSHCPHLIRKKELWVIAAARWRGEAVRALRALPSCKWMVSIRAALWASEIPLRCSNNSPQAQATTPSLGFLPTAPPLPSLSGLCPPCVTSSFLSSFPALPLCPPPAPQRPAQALVLSVPGTYYFVVLSSILLYENITLCLFSY